MKLIDYSKIDCPKFEPKNPVVFQGSKTKYYEIVILLAALLLGE